VISRSNICTLEGWLQTPTKQNIRRHGWKKIFVVVSSKNMIFFNSENERQNADPQSILDLNKVFHVRSVTQGDVIRAEAKDIPRIFQILYAGEGESMKPGDKPGFNDSTISSGLGKSDRGDSTNAVILKGHEFVAITFHIPASCDGCPKPLWGPFRPPPAMECKRCRVKFHKEHVTSAVTSGDASTAIYSADVIAPCKVSYDPTTAKEMLLMAPTVEEQQQWVGKLLKKIQKSGYKAATLAASSQPSLATLSIDNSISAQGSVNSNSSSYRVSPQESIRSSASFKGAQTKDNTNSQLQDSNRLKSSTLPGGNSTLSGAQGNMSKK